MDAVNQTVSLWWRVRPGLWAGVLQTRAELFRVVTRNEDLPLTRQHCLPISSCVPSATTYEVSVLFSASCRWGDRGTGRVFASCVRMRPECREVDGRAAGSRFCRVMWGTVDSEGRDEMPAWTVSHRWTGSTQSLLQHMQ